MRRLIAALTTSSTLVLAAAPAFANAEVWTRLASTQRVLPGSGLPSAYRDRASVHQRTLRPGTLQRDLDSVRLWSPQRVAPPRR